MNTLATILAITILFSGCAGTTVRDPKTGVAILHTNADFSAMRFRGPDGTQLDMTDVNHSKLAAQRWNGASALIMAGAGAAAAMVK